MAKFQGKHSEITDKILKAFYQVHTELGYGFSEKVYENALAILLRNLGLRVEQQVQITVYFQGQIVGEYIADLIIDDVVLLELKAVRKLIDQHSAQLLTYLKSTKLEVGLFLNFGPSAAFKRMVYDNDRKGNLSWIKK